MKITTFNPQIITNDPDSVIQLFEEMGFERRHNQKGIGGLEVTGIRMKDENGFYLDISVPNVKLEEDKVVIRMNVDDFTEAYHLLIGRGFKNIYGHRTADTASSKSALLISPTGFAINLIEHIKKRPEEKENEVKEQ